MRLVRPTAALHAAAPSPSMAPHRLRLGLALLLALCGAAAGDPRTAVAGQSCMPGAAVSGSALADNFVPAMDNLNTNVSANGFGTSAVGTGPNTVFGLGQCFRDLSPVDCKLCFAEVRSLLPKCYPRVGGRLYLDGCFGRYANYSFFAEAVGPANAAVCDSGSNYTANPRGFAAAVMAALANVTAAAVRADGYAVGSAVAGGATAFALAQCWQSLNITACGQCLRAAAGAAAECAPATQGRALYSGCYLRYSTRLFWNVNATAGSGSPGVPFNAINNDEFKQMLEAIGRFGPGFRGPSQYDVREPLLKEEVLRTNELLKAHEEERAMTGCSLMTDAWTDQKRRSIMNLCVHCNLGTSFIGSKETSDDAHTSEYIFEYVDGCIDTIGHQNVVQIVTDNASNNMGAKELMKAKRPNIFWSSCATHTINLMLQGIGNMPKYKKTLEQAKALTVFIYSHHKTLALMRKHTKRRDIIRPGVTRFASAFLTLQSLIEKKVELRAMALSKEWEESAHTKKGKGVTATATLISRSFWNGVNNALKIFEPLVKVLRMVDGDGPSMAFLYGEILEAKKKIKEALNNSESNYNLIINAIDRKMKGRLDSPLHLTAYLLNPYYSYGDRSIFLEQDIMDGFIECVEIFYHGNDEVMDQVLNVDFDLFKDKKETFGKTPARLGCQKRDLIPANWWSKYGCHVPHLQKFAIRILSLTSSSSGCERNWSTFDMVHTKKRNKLDAHRLNNLVYVQFNARLLNKKEKSNKKNIDVLLASHASNAQGWVIEGGDDDVDPETGLSWNLIDEAMGANEAMQPRRSTRVRELHEDDFDSESEEEEVNEDLENIEFESDQDEVVPTKDYGQEDED